MSLSFHNLGPAILKVGTGSGSPAALETVGVFEDGVSIALRLMMGEVKTDVAGPNVPADLQVMGGDANITGTLTAYDSALFQKIRAKALGSATDGTLGALGSFVATGGFAYRLVLSSADEPWRFYTATLRNAVDLKAGTVYTKARVSFYAWPFIAATVTTPAGVIWYDHTDA